MPKPRKGGKSVLMTPDPYHTPGYRGFCPQFKFEIGETFGRTTSRLLTNPKIARSSYPVLCDIAPVTEPSSNTSHYEAVRKEKLNLIDKRQKSRFGDQKLGVRMVPGYTGYIPKSQHYYGTTYGEICVNAISDFEKDYRKHLENQKRMQKLRQIQEGRAEKLTEKERKLLNLPENLPLKSLVKDVGPLVYLPKSKQHSTSPYYMDDKNPGKFFVSGYTGFVPRSRGYIGMGYPVVTNRALVDFTNDDSHAITKLKQYGQADTFMGQKNGVYTDEGYLPAIKGDKKPVIYPIDSGLVPNYTGHIPGEKFRYGTTFGHSTRNAKRISKGPPIAVCNGLKT
ncbi:hypothetical protein HOLleu_16934 [Holothuria leucospilota]|uniref:Ciliary microtubule inner protein 2A-C-like domain-containing protein n=1 Tax=Holothuria leucospilota TaxID=206669 RepID=A0A9Q1C765_HOLLE|nr:hypothetical protein HOLleu_16934 [Holothuria leucospilota]